MQAPARRCKQLVRDNVPCSDIDRDAVHVRARRVIEVAADRTRRNQVNLQSSVAGAGALVAAALLFSGACAENADTQIKLKYIIKATLAENPEVPGASAGASGPARHNFTIVLKPGGDISESYEGSGKFVLVRKNEAVLGADGQSLSYKVVDQNTIQRLASYESWEQTITIRVSGKSCSMQYEVKLKPGKKVFVAFSQSRGRMMNYRSFELIESSCNID
jgi:hypothetical protein